MDGELDKMILSLDKKDHVIICNIKTKDLGREGVEGRIVNVNVREGGNGKR